MKFATFSTGIVSLLAASVSASANPHLYPICFFSDTRPDQAEFNAYYVPRLVEAFRTSAVLGVHARISVSPDGRWLVANTSTYQNSFVSRVWPRIACIGNASNSDRVLAEENCVNYVSDFTRKLHYVSFGRLTVSGHDVVAESILNQNALHCRSILTKSDP